MPYARHFFKYGNTSDKLATNMANGFGHIADKLGVCINAVGVAELMGLVTATLTAGSTVVLYRKVLSRIGIKRRLPNGDVRDCRERPAVEKVCLQYKKILVEFFKVLRTN